MVAMTFLTVFIIDNGYFLLHVISKCFPLINIRIVSLLGPRTRWQHLRSRAVASNPSHNATVANFRAQLESTGRRVVLPVS